MDLHHRLARLKRLSSSSVTRAVARRLTAPGRRFLERSNYRFEGPRRQPPALEITPIWLFHPSATTAGFGESFRSRFPADAEALIATARRALEGTVDLFGQPVDLTPHMKDGRMPWHVDPKSGVAWDPRAWFETIRYGSGADIRVAWELSRCAHFVTLGQAYILTKDERFAKAFSDQIEDWMSANPVKFGVNWCSPMEVALRAGNWLAAWDLFGRSPSISDRVRARLPGSLWEHGRHIESHLEWGGELSTNHFLANLLGLWYIGRALNLAEWAGFGGEELIRGLLDQTYPDGMDFEGSTAYHRLVTEIGFYFCLLEPSLDRDNSPEQRRAALARVLGTPFIDRLAAMFRFIPTITGPAGRTPLIGDNDSARVHTLFRRPDNEMSYLGDLGTLLLGDNHLRLAAWPPASETAWIFGIDALASLSDKGLTQLPNRAPGNSGIAVLRGPTDAAHFLACPNGTNGIGNHTHNDKLSVLISVGLDDFLVDPGTAVYTGDPDRRNLYRSTRSHSTVMVDGLEQNRFSRENLFVIVDDTRVVVHEYRDGQRVSASHDGYRRLDHPLQHRRSLERLGQPLGWIIEDTLEGRGKHRAEWTFVCGPGIVARIDDANVVTLEGREGVLEMRAHSELLNFQLTEGEISPAYGTRQPVMTVRAGWSGITPFRVTFTLSYKRKD